MNNTHPFYTFDKAYNTVIKNGGFPYGDGSDYSNALHSRNRQVILDTWKKQNTGDYDFKMFDNYCMSKGYGINYNMFVDFDYSL